MGLGAALAATGGIVGRIQRVRSSAVVVLGSAKANLRSRLRASPRLRDLKCELPLQAGDGSVESSDEEGGARCRALSQNGGWAGRGWKAGIPLCGTAFPGEESGAVDQGDRDRTKGATRTDES